jgi:hypothetical protein
MGAMRTVALATTAEKGEIGGSSEVETTVDKLTGGQKTDATEWPS